MAALPTSLGPVTCDAFIPSCVLCLYVSQKRLNVNPSIISTHLRILKHAHPKKLFPQDKYIITSAKNAVIPAV